VKIGFIPHTSESKNVAAGTRIRVLNIVKHIEDAIVSNDLDELETCDVVVFQARWQDRDLVFAKA